MEVQKPGHRVDGKRGERFKAWLDPHPPSLAVDPRGFKWGVQPGLRLFLPAAASARLARS